MLDEQLLLQPSPALRESRSARFSCSTARCCAGYATPRRLHRGTLRHPGLVLIAAAVLAAAGVGAAAVVTADLDTRGTSRATPTSSARRPRPRATTAVPVEATAPTSTSAAPTVQRAPRSRHALVHAPAKPVRRIAAPPAVPTTRSAVTATTPVLTKRVHTHVAPTAHAPPRRPPRCAAPRRLRRHRRSFRTLSTARSAIDGTIWYQIQAGDGWSLSQHDGRLEYSFPAGTTPGGSYGVYGGHVGTLCKFPGDFDARVDYTLAGWPAANNTAVTLWAFFAPNNDGYQVWRQSSVQGGEQYGSYMAAMAAARSRSVT